MSSSHGEPCLVNGQPRMVSHHVVCSRRWRIWRFAKARASDMAAIPRTVIVLKWAVLAASSGTNNASSLASSAAFALGGDVGESLAVAPADDEEEEAGTDTPLSVSEACSIAWRLAMNFLVYLMDSKQALISAVYLLSLSLRFSAW